MLKKDHVIGALAVMGVGMAVMLYFSLQGKEEVKAEQRVERAEQRVESAKFDQDFAKGWNGSGKLNAPTDADIANLQKEVADAKKEMVAMDAQSKEDFNTIGDAINQGETGTKGGKPNALGDALNKDGTKKEKRK